jgi:type III secretion protein C
MAADQDVEFHKETVRIPGVAALLRQIVLGEKSEDSIGGMRVVERAPRFLKGTGMVPPKKPPEEPTLASEQPAEPAPAEKVAVPVRIVAEPRLNAVLVWDARYRMPYYKALIGQLDQPRRLVEIRAAIIDVSVDHSQDLGFAWDHTFQTGDVTHAGGANRGTASSPVDFASKLGEGLTLTTIYQHGINVLMAKARFLEENGDADVLSNPAVLTIDNVQAQIRHTQTFYVKLEGKEEVDLVDVTVGTVLQVTPHVIESRDGMRRVQMTVHIEDGTDESQATSKVDGVPRIVQSVVDTHAMVGEHQALIIGGNYSERKVNTDSGVPVLMHIPVLGHLAKNTTQSKVKTQRLFVLSPRIVDLDTLLASQGAGLEPVFDRSRRVDWAQRAFGDPQGSNDVLKENREQAPRSKGGN